MSKDYKDKELKNEINNSYPSFKPLIDAGHVKHVRGWAFDPTGRYIIINKHGQWFVYLPNETKQFGPATQSFGEAKRQANNMLTSQKTSQASTAQQKTLQDAIQKIDQTEGNIQESAEEEIGKRKEETDLYAKIYEESILTGKSPIDIATELRKEGTISSELFTKMMALFGKNSRLITEAELVESNEEKRRSILDELKDPKYKREAQDAAELELMSDKTVGSPALSEKMELIKENFPELASSISIPMLERLVAAGTFDEVIEGSRSLADMIKGETEKLPASRPTWEQSQEIFESKYKPNMAYPQLSPYRNAISDLAASGQAAGSTGFENARNAEQRAITREDFDFNKDIYRIMNEDWMNQGKGIDMLARGAKGYQDTILGPLKEQQESWQKGYAEEKNNELNQGKMNMGVAEGEMKNELLEKQNQITLNDRLNVQDDETYNWLRNMGNEIYQLKEYKDGRVIVNETRKLELLEFENTLWMQRAQIENLLRRMNNEEAAIALSQEKSKETWIQKALKYLPAVLTVGGAIVGGIAAGPGGAAAGAMQGAAIGANIGSAIQGGSPNYSNIPSGDFFKQPNTTNPPPDSSGGS